MRWTKKNRSIARKNKLESWHEWWAWHPVKVGYNDEEGGSITKEWLTKVWRKGWSSVTEPRRVFFWRFYHWEWKYKDNATRVKERLLKENLETNEHEETKGASQYGIPGFSQYGQSIATNAIDHAHLNRSLAKIQESLAKPMRAEPYPTTDQERFRQEYEKYRTRLAQGEAEPLSGRKRH